jgi:hypothetical protein
LLNKLFEDALSIHKSQERYIKKLKLPFYLQLKYLNDESLPKKDSKKCTNKSKKEESKIRSIVKVIGYNSRRFDVNVFIRKITDPKILIEDIIGNQSQYKSLTIKHENYPFKLQFVDLQMFLAGGTLDDNAKVFANSEDRVKGFFPYEKLTEDNYLEELLKSEPFKKEDFYSSLQKQNMSDEEYQNYLNDYTKMKDNLEYLRFTT